MGVSDGIFFPGDPALMTLSLWSGDYNCLPPEFSLFNCLMATN